MKKFLSLTLIILLIGGLFILTGCENKEEKENESAVEEEDFEEKTPTIIDRSNSKLQKEEDIKYEIEKATQRYFEMVYGDKVLDAKFLNIEIYKGDEEMSDYVDLAENDYAFEIDYEIKPSDEKYVNELTEDFGKYDEESGWIIENHGYGVMRYNEISDEYDVTSITPDTF